MEFTRVKIVTFTPTENADAIRKALGDASAGQLGEYSYCSFTSIGNGRYVPSGNANPHIGTPNVPETVEEERIEVICDRDKAKAAIAAMKQAHPYEEVAFDIYPLINEEQL
jgi:hypothetical protein